MKRSQTIALAGISAALSYVFIILSFYVDVMSVSFGVLAAICLMLPLTAGSTLGAIFSYVSASTIAGLTVGFGAVPFIVFYGPFVLTVYFVNFLLYPKLNLPKAGKVLVGYVIKGIVYAGTITALYFLMQAFGNVDTLFEGWMKWVSITLLVLIFFMFDILIHLVFVNLRHIILKRVLKVPDESTKRKATPEPDNVDSVDVDVFGIDEVDESNTLEKNDETSDDSNEMPEDSTSRFEHFLETEEKDDKDKKDD